LTIVKIISIIFFTHKSVYVCKSLSNNANTSEKKDQAFKMPDLSF